MKRIYFAIITVLFAAGCYFFPYSADIVSEKYQPATLQQDFTVFRTVLEKAHPGIYTYASKSEMDACFDSVYRTLNEPVDIRAFHQKLSFIIDRIGCSHTNLYLPKTYYDTILHRSNSFLFRLSMWMADCTSTQTVGTFRLVHTSSASMAIPPARS